MTRRESREKSTLTRVLATRGRPGGPDARVGAGGGCRWGVQGRRLRRCARGRAPARAGAGVVERFAGAVAEMNGRGDGLRNGL